MVFETLGVSLYDLVKQNNYKRLPLSCVRDVSRQLLQALNFLQSINMIHTGTHCTYCVSIAIDCSLFMSFFTIQHGILSGILTDADLKLENVLFTHNTLQDVVVNHGGKEYTVKVPVNTNIKRTLLPVYLCF